MTDSLSLRDQYLQLIDQIVQTTLKGNIRSKEQVYQMLVDGIQAGTGEVFEQGLSDRIAATQQQIETQTDELKQAKASRSLRAMQTIQAEWQRWQKQNQVAELLDTAARQVLAANDADTQPDRLSILIQVTDPNRPKPLNLAEWQQLAKKLQAGSSSLNATAQGEIQELAQGVLNGLASWQRLENSLVSWIYDQSQGQLGFEGVPGQRGPWAVWAKQVGSPVLQSLFQTLALEGSAVEWAAKSDIDVASFVELLGILRCLQQGLVNWFDKLVYDSKVGAKLSISTFLAFAVVWSQLASGFTQLTIPSRRDRLSNACFQVTLQILRLFSQRDYFPLYGGIYASFSGEYLRDALHYLDEPLRRAEGTQEKARILTLLGYSARAMGQPDRALSFHQQALEIARAAGDRSCEIANLNHLSRVYVAQQNYAEAINTSQRALILSRQAGDRPGEANATANLGYSEVLQAQQLEQVEPEVYEMAIERLQQGLQLAERLGDRQSQALCLSSLGIAHVVVEQPQTALPYLEKGIQAAQVSGDLYLQGLNLSYLAEAQYHLENIEKAVLAASLGMYLLEQIGSTAWRQPAGLLTVMRGRLGEEAFNQHLKQQRSGIIAAIGVDGYDHLPTLLQRYQN